MQRRIIEAAWLISADTTWTQQLQSIYTIRPDVRSRQGRVLLNVESRRAPRKQSVMVYSNRTINISSERANERASRRAPSRHLYLFYCDWESMWYKGRRSYQAYHISSTRRRMVVRYRLPTPSATFSGGSIGGGGRWGRSPPPYGLKKIFFLNIYILFIIEKNSFLV